MPGDDHLAGVDAHPHLQADAVGGLELDVELLEGGEHGQRGPHGARGVVLA